MGIHGSLGFQGVQGSGSELPGREEGGVNLAITEGGVIAMMAGGGERFCPGENEGQEKGSYKSNKLMGEKA